MEKRGYKELILTAQDTTKYGLDLYKKSRLAELITEISKIDGIKWIRFLYSYPETIDEDLIKVVRENKMDSFPLCLPREHYRRTNPNSKKQSKNLQIL